MGSKVKIDSAGEDQLQIIRPTLDLSHQSVVELRRPGDGKTNI